MRQFRVRFAYDITVEAVSPFHAVQEATRQRVEEIEDADVAEALVAIDVELVPEKEQEG